ncbi:MAG: sulfite exporter TauE/SafE family protein [Bacteroidetes bacterium]|nr:MAG: sulfite exporter TauE/SafE family protein [Bacteroidota bacterium]
MTEIDWLIGSATTAIAFLYSSVGHAGASGYIALLALTGTAAEDLRSSALMLNILVSLVTSVLFLRSGHWSARLFFPSALASVPLAAVGGMITLPATLLHTLIGLVLVYSAFMFIIRPREAEQISEPPLPILLVLGGAIGLLSGMIGVGGGIFLTPLLISLRWSTTKTAAGVSSLFILLNSLSGLAGVAYGGGVHLSPQLPVMAVSTLVGGSIGATMGSGHFSVITLKRILAAVLMLAGGKLILL